MDACSASLEDGSLVKLGQALRPALPVDDPPGPEHALQILKRSCSPQIFAHNVKTPCHRQRNCDCLKCLCRHLSKLPPEVFTEIIFMATPSTMSRLLTIFGETSKLLSELKKESARHLILSCQGDVFQTSIEYGNKSYVTGLYDHEVSHSKKLKSQDTICDYLVVWADRIGVTKVEFLRSDVSTSGHSIKPTSIKCRNCLYLNAKNPLTIRSNREWVHVINITEARIHLQSKVCAQFKGVCILLIRL